MAINSRRKGAKNEREVAKVLEIWTKKKFAKTPASGGLNWRNSTVAGDVVCTTEGHYFPFCIEGKFYDKIDFSHLINPSIKNCDIISFWNQAKTDAAKVNKVPLLLMRYNGLPKRFWFLGMPIDFLVHLEASGIKIPKHHLMWIILSEEEGIAIMPSTHLFNLRYKPIKMIAKAYGKKNKNKTKK